MNLSLAVLTTLCALCGVFPAALAEEPIDIGSRRELFVDEYLIENLDGVRLKTGWPWVVADPQLPQTRTCPH